MTEVGLDALAAVLGISPADVGALEREGLPIATRKPDKVYALAPCVQWYVDYRVRQAALNIPPRVKTAQFGALVGIASRQVTNLVEKGMHSIVEGNSRSIPLPDAVHWYIAFKLKEAGRGDRGSPINQAKLRKIELEVQREEISLLKDRGELVDREMVERLIADIFQSLRAEMLNFPARWAADLIGCDAVLEMRQRLKTAVHESIERLGASAKAAGERVRLTADESTDEDAADDAAIDDDEDDDGLEVVA